MCLPNKLKIALLNSPGSKVVTLWEHSHLAMAALAALESNLPSLRPETFNDRFGSSFENQDQWERIASTGFSDTSIFRLTTSQGAFAVRSWPSDGASWDKVHFWDLLQRNDSFRPFPKLIRWCGHSIDQSLLFAYGNKLWSLSDWIEGRPLQLPDLTLGRVRELATILAKIHVATIESLQSEAMPPPSHRPSEEQELGGSRTLIERSQFLATVDHSWDTGVKHSEFYRKHKLVDPLLLCLSKIQKVKNLWTEQLDRSSRIRRRYHWIVRDLWYENVLVSSSGDFSSIVDLGAARFDWPGLDFTRLFGSIMVLACSQSWNINDTSNWWDNAYAAYISNHPTHSLGPVQECIDLNEIATALSVVQWIKWIESGVVRFNSQEDENRVAHRINQLCQTISW